MSNSPFSLQNKTILITGASSGIGRATAVECSKAGASLIITGRNSERLTETFNHLVGSNHIMIIADLKVEKQLEQLIERTPLLDGIVYSAGVVTTLPFQFITKEKLDDVFSINFYIPTLISQLLIRQKKVKNGASIVWISSIAGNQCVSFGGALYAATKSAVNGLVKGMALDLSSKGIRVNSVNPAVIETSIFSEGVITAEQLKEEMKKYPLKRYGKPEEVAYAAIYLLSEASAWVTGSSLIIDGGFTLL